ncbi:MAG: DsbA family oxidoreductase [Salinarimonas sp.]|nr:DsbA family oxidoreductase [Salinarimonas sp.]
MSEPLRITVISDVICPWCYLGKRRLESALAESGVEASVSWLPFELNPDMPEGGMPRADYRAQKFGAEKGAELDAEMKQRGDTEGVHFAFEKMVHTPNTRRAHMLVAQASDVGLGDDLTEALFRAYFEEGADVGDPQILIGIAEQVGLDPELAGEVIRSEAISDAVATMESRATEVGVTGVPFFIINEKYAVSGAQPKEAWLEFFEKLQSDEGPEAGPAA